MEAHGYGYKTFQFEADAEGRPVVHTVIGKHSSYYENNSDTRDNISSLVPDTPDPVGLCPAFAYQMVTAYTMQYVKHIIRVTRSAAVCCKYFVFSFLPIRKVSVLPFAGGALAPLLGVFSFVFSELSTGSSFLLLVL